jgi:predicted ATPase
VSFSCFDGTLLTDQYLGPADYLSLASTFDTFYIDAVPVLYLRNKNEARRLINLIDALCESLQWLLLFKQKLTPRRVTLQAVLIIGIAS